MQSQDMSHPPLSRRVRVACANEALEERAVQVVAIAHARRSVRSGSPSAAAARESPISTSCLGWRVMAVSMCGLKDLAGLINEE